MSKIPVIVCDCCGQRVSGMSYSALWCRLSRQGWTKGRRHGTHFCFMCWPVTHDNDKFCSKNEAQSWQKNA